MTETVKVKGFFLIQFLELPSLMSKLRETMMRDRHCLISSFVFRSPTGEANACIFVSLLKIWILEDAV